MDLWGQLVLLLCMAASEVQEVQARPNDYVCDPSVRASMNKVKELEASMSRCNDSPHVITPIQLPCVKIHVVTWNKKTLQQKRDEIKASLKAMLDDLLRAVAQTTSPCRKQLLESLVPSVTNHLLIVSNLPLAGGDTQEKPEGPDPTCKIQKSQNLRQVLQHFNSLLMGRMDWLMGDLQDTCLQDR